MQVLADSEIRKLINMGWLGLEPELDLQQMTAALQPASLDLRLGAIYRQRMILDDFPSIAVLEERGEDHFWEEIDFDGEIVLGPVYSSLETKERLKIPKRNRGRVFQRSRYGRILAEAGAFALKDDDYPLMEKRKDRRHVRYNLEPHLPTKFVKGERVCQLVLFDRKGKMMTAHDAIDKGYLEVSEGTKICFGCGNIVLYAGEVYSPYSSVIDPNSGKPFMKDPDNFERIEERLLPPERVYLATTRERFKFSDRIAGIVESRPCSSLWHMNNYIHSCFEAGWVDPGYEGPLTMQIYSRFGPIDLELPITILTLYPVKGKVERPYGLLSLASEFQGNLDP